MSAGSRSIFLALTTVFVSLLAIIGGLRLLCIWIWGQPHVERGDGFFRQIYLTFLQMTDPGNMAQDIESSPWVKVFTILAGITGIVMLSSLIAFITTALDSRLQQLRKGHSKVVLDDHTLILGWNSRVVDILRELVLANESEDKPSVVILADQDKEFMDDYLGINLPDTRNTKVVTRSGTVSSLVNLEIASAESCKSVIALARCNIGATPEQLVASDYDVIRSVLAVSAATEGLDVPIVAEVFGGDHRRIAEGIAPGRVVSVDANEILAKILVQTSRSVGLSVVYEEMLSFDGAEMYFYRGDWNAGSRFGDLAYHFPDGVPLGVRHADGTLVVNPPSDLAVRADDEVLILAQDDSTIAYQRTPVVVVEPIAFVSGSVERHVERELLIGWNDKVETIIAEYADYVMDGSEIHIVLRAPDDSVSDRVADIDAATPGVAVSLIDTDPFSTESLTQLQPFSYDNIIILSQSHDGVTEDQVDSETLLILLQLQAIFRAGGPAERTTKLIAEILDSENRALVSQTGVRDFIISNGFISMLVAQISEQPEMRDVYDDLFEESGSEVYLKPLELYLPTLPTQVTFGDLIAAAQNRGEIALGVKLAAQEENADANFGVELIPPKDRVIDLRAGDTLVVVAEDES